MSTSFKLGAVSRTQAERLIEALFPAGEQLPASNTAVIMQQVEAMLAEAPLLGRSLVSLLHMLDARYLLTHGQRFSRASVSARSQFLRDNAQSPLLGGMLRALSMPFRTAYLNHDAGPEKLLARPPAEAPATVESARWQQQCSQAADFSEDQELECDVVIVGTGAGGAAAAYELASQGLAVVIIEEGHYYDRRDFTGAITDLIPKLYRANGSTGAIGSTYIPIPIGRSVGGTTTVNSGTCLRTPAATLADWQREGLHELTTEQLQPFFELVEEVLSVQQAEPRYVGEIAHIIEKGARRIGLTQVDHLQRNAVGCDGQGLCQFGCPTGAKQSTNVSFIPRALERGAFLFTDFCAETLIHEGSRVAGVIAEGRGSEGKPVRLRVKAGATIIAMGTLMTPGFLQRNGVKHPLLGQNLSIHPAGIMTAWFPDQDFRNGATIPQGYGVSDLKAEGLMFEGGSPPLLWHGMLSPLQAEDHVRHTERYQQTAYFGLMIKDTSRGSVRPGLHRDMPLIRYSLNAQDFALFKRGIDLLARMYLAAGAREVYIQGLTRLTTIRNVAELEAFWRSKPRPRHFLITAYHPLGTARLGASAAQGVCNQDHQVWGHTDLYVMDGACVPSSLGANPQVTIMALATRAARKLGQKLTTNTGAST